MSCDRRWTRKAQFLNGYNWFDRYPYKKRQEILRKGFLGRFPPDQAVGLAQDQVKKGIAVGTPLFNRKHGLLTSENLKQARKRLGISQAQFASYLKVGIASVERWEAGLIQDQALDELIRLKTDPEYARRNVREIENLPRLPSGLLSWTSTLLPLLDLAGTPQSVGKGGLA
ncbi:MAG: helix-turn-helix domain-containing protein [Bryobacteraceae bacterium]